MRVIYLAHPITARSQWGISQNIRAAERLALVLWHLGAAVICPGKNTENYDGDLPRDAILAGDLEIMRRCDAVVAAPGWRDSFGAADEVDRALLLGLPVFQWPDDADKLEVWISRLTSSTTSEAK